MGWEGFALLCIIFLLVVVLIASKVVRRELVYDTEFAVLYKDGKLVGELEPGAHWIMPMRDRLRRIDRREYLHILPGQEVLTQDRIAMKLSLTLRSRPSDPRKILTESVAPDASLLESGRLELRAALAEMTLDEVLDARLVLGAKLLSALQPRASALGYELSSVEVRDVMLPNNLKRAYSGVLEAQKNSERRLELARGEHAVMRSLANSAKMLEKNPALSQARILQALDGGGNTIVFGSSDVPVISNPEE